MYKLLSLLRLPTCRTSTSIGSLAIAFNAFLIAQSPSDFGVETGSLLYHSSMTTEKSVEGWIMEGPGKVLFSGEGMSMFSPKQEMHHVYWCPKALPSSFAAQWDMKNLNLEAGLCIVFFAATGLNGEDIMDPSLPERDGTFSQYNNQALKNYHISYYANTPRLPDRPVARLRKNPGKRIVNEGPPGILVSSSQTHRITLIKEEIRIRLYVDERLIIDWEDAGNINGEALGAGKIGLRQMQWTHFRYRNFKVWSLD
ncbi:MAG: DUF1961 family protein [Verrucomicrobiota bacterium]